MSNEDEKKVEVVFHNNIKSPSMQPFGRRKLVIVLSTIFVVNELILKIIITLFKLSYWKITKLKFRLQA